MRIIAGEFRSRRLKTLRGPSLRPTSDRLRETLFDVLGDTVAGSIWLDCYAGSGAVGLEALSRGAAQVIFLEQGRASARILRENIAALGVADRTRVLETSVAQGLGRLAASWKNQGLRTAFVFLDPPYRQEAECQRALLLLASLDLVTPSTLVIAEHARRAPPPATCGRLVRIRLVEQGDSALSFYRGEEPYRLGRLA